MSATKITYLFGLISLLIASSAAFSAEVLPPGYVVVAAHLDGDIYFFSRAIYEKLSSEPEMLGIPRPLKSRDCLKDFLPYIIETDVDRLLSGTEFDAHIRRAYDAAYGGECYCLTRELTADINTHYYMRKFEKSIALESIPPYEDGWPLRLAFLIYGYLDKIDHPTAPFSTETHKDILRKALKEFEGEKTCTDFINCHRRYVNPVPDMRVRRNLLASFNKVASPSDDKIKIA